MNALRHLPVVACLTPLILIAACADTSAIFVPLAPLPVRPAKAPADVAIRAEQARHHVMLADRVVHGDGGRGECPRRARRATQNVHGQPKAGVSSPTSMSR